MLKMGKDEYKLEDVLAVYFKDENTIELVDYNHDIHVYTKEDEPDFEAKLKYCKGKLYKNMFLINNQLFIRIIRIHSLTKPGDKLIRVRYGYRDHEEFNIEFESEERRNKSYWYFNRQLKGFYDNANLDNNVLEMTEFDYLLSL